MTLETGFVIILIIAALSLIGNFYQANVYAREKGEATNFAIIQKILFDSDWEAATRLAQKEWTNVLMVYKFRNIAVLKIQNKVIDTLKRCAMNPTVPLEEFVSTLRKMTVIAESDQIFNHDIGLAVRSVLKESAVIEKLCNKLMRTHTERTFGERVLIVAGFLPDEGTSYFLLNELFSMRFFEWHVLNILRPVSGEDLEKQLQELSPKELLAIQKIRTFLNTYDSGDYEARERNTLYFQGLFNKHKVLA